MPSAQADRRSKVEQTRDTHVIMETTTSKRSTHQEADDSCPMPLTQLKVMKKGVFGPDFV
jgi:hypothetical protein